MFRNRTSRKAHHGRRSTPTYLAGVDRDDGGSFLAILMAGQRMRP